jgi:protein TonB
LSSPPNQAEILPLVRIPPTYPPRALRERIEGGVTIEFTISVEGRVTDAVVVESSPPGVFDEAALQAISKWRYYPRVEDGVAVERKGVRAEIRFEMAPQEL